MHASVILNQQEAGYCIFASSSTTTTTETDVAGKFSQTRQIQARLLQLCVNNQTLTLLLQIWTLTFGFNIPYTLLDIVIRKVHRTGRAINPHRQKKKKANQNSLLNLNLFRFSPMLSDELIVVNTYNDTYHSRPVNCEFGVNNFPNRQQLSAKNSKTSVATMATSMVT